MGKSPVLGDIPSDFSKGYETGKFTGSVDEIGKNMRLYSYEMRQNTDL